MANFAPVAPPQLLSEFKKQGQLGDYHLLLAHDIVAKPDIYREIFARSDWNNMTIILDNSVIELGNAVDLEVIVRAAQIIKPSTTVLPDALVDKEVTIARCDEALDKWTEAFRKANLEPKFMIVPQGKDIDEWIECAEHFQDTALINWWGIPRNIVNVLGASRQPMPQLVHALNPHRGIHLLGFSDDIHDDIMSASQNYVAGIDSAVPIRAVSHQIPMTIKGFNDMPPRGNWWEEAKFDPLMITNLRTARRWFA